MDQEGAVGALRSFIRKAPDAGGVDLLALPAVGARLEGEIASFNRRGSLEVIDTEAQLAARCSSLERDLKYSGLRRGASDLLNNLFNVAVVPEGVDVSFKLGVLQGFGASEAKLDQVYLLRRDSMFGHTVSRFLSAFKPLPPDIRPKIVFDAQGEIGDAVETLSWARDAARVFTPATDGVAELVLPKRSATSDRFADLCLGRAYSSCAELALVRPEPGAAGSLQRRYVAALYQRVQAKKGCDRRFDAEADLRELESFLLTVLEDKTRGDLAWFAEALVFTLLDRAYVLEESASPVEHALTLARFLDDELLEAFALRFANFTAGVSPFALEQLGVASARLLAAGRLGEFVSTRTNAVLTAAHAPSPRWDLGETAALAEFALEWTPYADRLSSVLNVVGISFLLSNRLDDAADYFRRAARANGGRLHQISAQVNEEIALRLAGETGRDAHLARICAAITQARMSTKLSYHHTYLYANLAALAGADLRGEIQQLLKQQRFMDYGDEDVDQAGLFGYLASNFSWVSQGARFRGARGEFVDRHGLLPLAQFIWS